METRLVDAARMLAAHRPMGWRFRWVADRTRVGIIMTVGMAVVTITGVALLALYLPSATAGLQLIGTLMIAMSALPVGYALVASRLLPFDHVTIVAELIRRHGREHARQLVEATHGRKRALRRHTVAQRPEALRELQQT